MSSDQEVCQNSDPLSALLSIGSPYAASEKVRLPGQVAARNEQIIHSLGIDRMRRSKDVPASATFLILGFANQTSCAPTIAQIARAEADPIYSFQLHAASSGEIAGEQARMLKAGGGQAVPYGRPSAAGLEKLP